MKRLLLILLLAPASGACMRHRPVVDSTHPYAAEQQAAKEEVPKRYDVNHNPDDTMSINTMGSD